MKCKVQSAKCKIIYKMKFVGISHRDCKWYVILRSVTTKNLNNETLRFTQGDNAGVEACHYAVATLRMTNQIGYPYKL